MWNAISLRIWTRVAVSISYDDNHYTTGTSSKYYLSEGEYDSVTGIQTRLSWWSSLAQTQHKKGTSSFPIKCTAENKAL